MDFVSELRDGYSKKRIVKEPAQIKPAMDTAAAFTPYKGLSPTTRTIAMTAPMVLAPTLAFAADAFEGVHSSLMKLFDGAVVLLIIFAGGVWGTGHRSKAIELLICVSFGYLIARNAINIRDYLKSIGG